MTYQHNDLKQELWWLQDAINNFLESTPHKEYLQSLHDRLNTQAEPRPAEDQEPITADAPLGKTRSIDQLPEKLQIEWLKAALVITASAGQELEIWALNNPMSGNGQTRPTVPDMDFYPQDIQDRIAKQRNAWINGGEANG